MGERKEDGREEMNQGRLAEMAILKKQEEYVLRTVSGSFRGNWSAVGRRYSEAPPGGGGMRGWGGDQGPGCVSESEEAGAGLCAHCLYWVL